VQQALVMAFIPAIPAEHLWPRRLAGLLDGRAANLEDLADLPGEARLSIDHLMHHGR
jgi:hypothetical protein